MGGSLKKSEGIEREISLQGLSVNSGQIFKRASKWFYDVLKGWPQLTDELYIFFFSQIRSNIVLLTILYRV